MSTDQGADELRMRALLLTRQVGPDAIPPKPKSRPRDWLDDLLDADTAPEPEPVPEAEEEPGQPEPAETPAPAKKQNPAREAAAKKPGKKRKKPKPGAPRAAEIGRAHV